MMRPSATRHAVIITTLLGSLALLVSSPATSDEVCSAHFAKLRAIVAGSGANKPVPASELAAVTTELALEKTLWDEELAHQKSRLASVPASQAAPALDRLTAIGRDLDQVFAALQTSVEKNAPFDPTALTKALSCTGDEGTLPRWPAISAAQAPTLLPTLTHREPEIPAAPPRQASTTLPAATP